MSTPVNNVQTIALSGLPIILLVVAVALVIWQVTHHKSFPTGHKPALHQALLQIPLYSDESGKTQKKEPKKVLIQDPFYRNQPPPAGPEATAMIASNELVELQLTTIAQGKMGSYCLINGQIFHEKQSDKGFTVHSIQPDYIIISTSVENIIIRPGEKVTLEEGKVLNKEDKTTKTGINKQ